jgi:hypothetical protein
MVHTHEWLGAAGVWRAAMLEITHIGVVIV